MSIFLENLPKKANNFHDSNMSESRLIKKKCAVTCPLSEVNCQKFSSTVLPPKHLEFVEEIKSLEIYEDDVWVISYPKCGTTWTQEAVYQICTGVDLDSEKSKESLRSRFPFFEFASLVPFPYPSNIERVKQLPRPRFIKSHLPICFLPENLWKVAGKIIYVARDAKDAAVSYYHQYHNWLTYQGTMDDFCELYLEGLVQHGSYWDHVEQYLLLRQLPNFKFIKYDDMQQNLKEVLLNLASFLKKELSEDQLDKLLKHLKFDNMKNSAAVNYSLQPATNANPERAERCKNTGFNFMRRGQQGSHKDEMSEELVAKFDEKTKTRVGNYDSL